MYNKSILARSDYHYSSPSAARKSFRGIVKAMKAISYEAIDSWIGSIIKS